MSINSINSINVLTVYPNDLEFQKIPIYEKQEKCKADVSIIIKSVADIVEINKRYRYKIIYPIRIHSKNCKCNSLCSRKERLGYKNVVFIIEKLYTDEKYKHYPNRIFICDYINDPKIFDSENFFCCLFDNVYYEKYFVLEYFRHYKWSPTMSKRIRHLLTNVSSICMCPSLNNTINRYNAGIIIVGNKNQIKPISSIFNECVTKTEFSKLSSHKVNKLYDFNKKNINHTINNFILSREINTFTDKYTLIGSENNGFDEENYSFSFGKREWYSGNEETSFECAKRELFEEFNIQFSESIITFNKNIKVIRGHITLLFIIELPPILKISYYEESDTIYLDTDL
ncbi:putative divergent NUDIX hydrolase [Cotonvirus japonicus]|uniref:Divergent NUDIX hydrolase n=1 Tax=Cotonvirus japonicus TaxID=2811091 RepID=A0ABM7NT31_9VIRU|nr:putative divergent NUDIX hydrolase [Cotonvirus japonicus]BCS83325.1 putative divergent NUDIX hydrolase [Cotonvirus japonicus]